MDYDNGFILQKTVDWSLLNDEMTIPVSMCSLFYPTPHRLLHSFAEQRLHEHYYHQPQLPPYYPQEQSKVQSQEVPV